VATSLAQALIEANESLLEKKFSDAERKFSFAVRYMGKLAELILAEQDKVEALSRDLEAARAEVAALKPQAAAQASLTQERKKSEQREAELQQARQKAEALSRDLEAARAEVAALKPQARSGEPDPGAQESRTTRGRAAAGAPEG